MNQKATLNLTLQVWLVRPHRYNSLAFALGRKEQLGRYGEAQMTRRRLLKTFQEVDKLSKQLLAMGQRAQQRTKGHSSGQVRIYKGIRGRVSEYLALYMVTLPKLPEQTEIDRWRAEFDASERARVAPPRVVRGTGRVR